MVIHMHSNQLQSFFCYQLLSQKFYAIIISRKIFINIIDMESNQQTNVQTLEQVKTLRKQNFVQTHINKGIPFQFTTLGLPSVIAKKISGLVKIMNSEKINISILKTCLAEGIPDQASIVRQFCWKIILGYLPEQKSKWLVTIEKHTTTYEALVNMFLPIANFQGYPLILKKEHPRYKQLENDYLLWEQIQKDTSRTHAQFSFFSTQSQQIMIPYLTSARREKFKLINGDNELTYKEFLVDKQKQRKTYRYDYMTRILYIYSKLNPQIQYVQGMNQILAPIFYLVNAGKSSNAIQQASCFYMFNSAISDIIELHIKDLDKSQNGVYGKLNQVNEMLVVIEPLIWSKLQKLKIDPFFYCFRWITLLFAQDFALFDTLRIWESIFSSEDRLQFINFIAIAIIMSCKEVIINNQFTVILEHMQNIRDHININFVIQIANQLFIQFKDKNFKEQATQRKKAFYSKEKQRLRYQYKLNKDRDINDHQQYQGSKKSGLFQKFTNYFDKFFD